MNDDIQDLLDEAGHNPEVAFNMLFDDMSKRMRERRVSEDAIEGMQIALMLAYRLGEASARKPN